MKILAKRALKIGPVILVGALASQCGKLPPQVKNQYRAATPGVSDQIGRKVDKSDIVYDNPETFYRLGQTKQEALYEGTLIVWNENADPGLVSKVIEVGKESKRAELDYKVTNSLDTEIKDLGKTIKDLKERLNEKNDDKVIEFYAQQAPDLLTSSQAWFDNNIADDKRSDAEQFCDAALLRFSASSFLRETEFSARPTPLGICESQYAKKKYFDTDVCKTVKSGAGNFFDCFWTAVLGSSLPKNKSFTLPRPVPLEASEIEALKSNLDSIRSVASLGGVMTNGKVLKNLWIYTTKPTGGPLFFNSIALKSPALFLKDAVDGLGILNEEKKDLEGKKFTFNDRVFNFHLAKTRDVLPKVTTEQEAELETSKETLSLVLGKKVPEFKSITEEERKKIERDLATAEDYEKSLKSERAADAVSTDDKFTKWSQLKADGASQLHDQELASTIWSDMVLTLTTDGDRLEVVYKVDFYLSQKSARGCYDTKERKSIDCEALPSGQETFPLQISLEPKTGKLSFEIAMMDNPTLFGLKKYEGTAAKYQKLSASEFAGKRLVYELSPARYKGKLDVMSGSFYAYDGSKEVFQGSLSFSKPQVSKR